MPNHLTSMVVETTDNRLFAVEDAGPETPQAWWGIEMIRRGGGLIPKPAARAMLVRRAGCRLVASATA